MNLFYIFLALFLGGLLTRNIYEVLKKAGKVNAKNKVLFAFIFASMMILWISWFSMCPADPYRAVLPGFVKWIGLAAVILGWALALTAMIQLRGVENIDHLVTSGVFSIVRHPMYTGFLLWIFGWVLFHGAVFSFFFGLLAIASVLYWRSLEEKALEVSYGETYREYRKRTRF